MPGASPQPPPPAYDGILLDLFGTVLTFDGDRLPRVHVDGQEFRSTLPALMDPLRRFAPHVTPGGLMQALRAASADLLALRGAAHVEYPSRERFRRALERLAVPPADIPEAAALCSRVHLATLAACTVLPPAHGPLLARLAVGHRLAVVSNFDDAVTVDRLLVRFGLRPLITSVVVSESIGVRKPNPVLVLLALSELGIPAARALMVGDTLAEDVGAAAAAGVDAAWIDARGEGPPASAPPPRFIVRHLLDVEEIVIARSPG